MRDDDAATALAALGHRGRLAVFRLLAAAAPGGLAAGEIAGRMGMPASTLSGHLDRLTAAGLLIRSKAGRSVRYAISGGTTAGLIGYLLEDCCRGRPDLCLGR